jgi:hypothetical protein
MRHRCSSLAVACALAVPAAAQVEERSIRGDHHGRGSNGIQVCRPDGTLTSASDPSLAWLVANRAAVALDLVSGALTVLVTSNAAELPLAP